MDNNVRLIDANALMEHVKDLPTWWADGGGCYKEAPKYPDGMFYPEDVTSSIENAPTVDAVPVVHGRWMENEEAVYKDGYIVQCSVCGGDFFVDYHFFGGVRTVGHYVPNYCPRCGAKMDGGADNG